MKPSFTVFIPAPRVLSQRDTRPEAVLYTLEALCAFARVPLRVTGGPQTDIFVHDGTEHARAAEGLYVGGKRPRTRLGALRVLEVLAYGFHDYAARECVCYQGLFSVPRPRGRPSLSGRSMTDAERMRRMREKKRLSPGA